MATTTSKEYRNQVMYCVYVRNYSEEGTFEALRRDLDRIQALGVAVIWLMPIHPCGLKCRKGGPWKSLCHFRLSRCQPGIRNDGGFSAFGG